ncbi:MAG: hypothetical protein P4M05_28030 [Bradyrhizobium sp.]|nr:hypothetical protein [Bradyrhizobium sp.]
MIREPKESGWYLARRFPTATNDEEPVVVRVSLDAEDGVTTVWEIGKRDPSTLDDWRLEAKIHRDASATNIEVDLIRRACYEHGLKMGAMAEAQKHDEYMAERERKCPTFVAWTDDPAFCEIGEPIIAIHMRAEHAKVLSNMISDLLCWSRGFRAALGPDECDRAPMGLDAVRTIRMAIQKAQQQIERSEKK